MLGTAPGLVGSRSGPPRTAPLPFHLVRGQASESAREIVAGEQSVYRIMAFVAMKIELSRGNASFRSSGFRKL